MCSLYSRGCPYLSLQLNAYFSHWVIRSLNRILAKYIFFSFVFVGRVAESVLISWFMLDLRTIIFIYLIFNFKLNYVNNLIHYYLVQVRARIGLFFRILFSVRRFANFEWLFLILKLGIVPFHFWYLSLVVKLDWERLFLLISTRKIIALVIVFTFINKIYFFLLCLNLGFVIYYSLFEKHLKILLGFSSIFNMVWVLRSRASNYYWVLYFVGYSLNLFLMLWVLGVLGKIGVRDLNQFFEIECVFFLGINVFLIVGLPPFLGFSIKMFMLREIVRLGGYLIMLVALRAFFVYLYIMFFFYSLSSYLESGNSLGLYNLVVYVILIVVLNFLFRVLFILFYYINNS